MNEELFGEDYYERGVEKKISGYTNYRYIPTRSYEEASSLKERWRTGTVLDYGCFTAGTKIRTSNKEDKRIEKLKVGDYVLSHNLKECQIVDIFNREADVYKVSSLYSMDWETTKEHPFLILRGSVVSFIEAENLKKGDYFVIPKEKGLEKQEELAELLGFYLAEGSIVRSHGKESNPCGVSFAFHYEEKEYQQRVKELGEFFNCSSVSIYERKERNLTEVIIFGKELAIKLKELGGELSHEKRINLNSVINWDDNSKKLLLKRWLDGDGGFQKREKKGQVCYGTSVSEKLIEGIIRVSHSLGICPSLYLKKPRDLRKQAYVLAFSGDSLNKIFGSGTITYTSKKRYKEDENNLYIPFISMVLLRKDTVYNLTVEKDHSYIANNVAVHNCAKGYLVHALRQLGFNAYGQDISKYAIENCHPEVKDYVDYEEKNMGFQYVICKDVMEHVPEDYVLNTLRVIKSSMMADKDKREALFVIPLGDDDKFRIREYEMDVTHVTKKDEDWWINKFKQAGFEIVDFKYRFGDIKKKWQSYEHGNGFFFVR